MNPRDLERTTWAAELDEQSMLRLFGAPTLQRATPYAHDGAIERLTVGGAGEVILASVRGTRATPYQVVLQVDRPTGGDRVRMTARCSCPVGSACKHAAAVLIHLRDAHDAVAAAHRAHQSTPWREVLAPITALSDGADEQRVTAHLPPAGLFVEVARRPPSAWERRGELVVTLRGTRWGKTRRWVRNLGLDALAHGQPDYRRGGATPLVEQSHAQLLSELISLAHQGARRGYSYGYGGMHASIDLDDVGSAFWPWAARADEARLALLGPAEDPAAGGIDLAPVSVVVDLARGDDGLILRAMLDGVLDEDARVQFVGSPPHAAVVETADRYTVRPVDGLSDEVVALLRAGRVHIPTEDEVELVEEYLPGLRRMTRLQSTDGSVDLSATARLRLVAEVRSPSGDTVEVAWGVETLLGSDTSGSSASPVRPLRPGGREPRPEVRELLSVIEPLADVPGVRRRGHWHEPPSHSRFSGADAVRWVEDVGPRLAEHPDVRLHQVDRLTLRESGDDPLVTVEVREADERGTDWFDLEVSVALGEEEVPLADLLIALAKGEQVMVLTSGTWFTLDRPELDRLRELLDEGRDLSDGPEGTIRISRHHVGYYDELVALGVVERECALWSRQRERLRAVQIESAPPVPDGATATLRPYQSEGYQWLAGLWDAGLGGILADDMGLGKTLQVLMTLARARERGDLDGPVLVVAPTSVLQTWVSEAARFTPSLAVVARPRTAARSARSLEHDLAEADIVVTSYAVLRLDAEPFAEHSWRAVVLDEAHMVKNHQSKTYRAVRGLRREVTYAVTGTPVENHLMELWSLLSLSAPGLYPRPEVFHQRWRRPIEAGDAAALATLHRRIRPLMLRRTKDEVALDLPPKTVQILPVDLTPGHRRIYDRHLQRERQRMLGLLDDPDANRVAILASLTRMRQLALDPRLGAADEEITAKVRSAKIETLVEHLAEVVEEGHRALVFSQFTRFLALVRERLTEAGLATSYLDGSTTDRAGVITRFRTGTDPVFLISLKAGGVGLTLTEADYVYVLDPWWNPAAESQAIDRAHRIGQDKPVMVYRLVSTGTIEEKVVALQERKRDLVARVVDDDPFTGGLSVVDLQALLDGDEGGPPGR